MNRCPPPVLRLNRYLIHLPEHLSLSYWMFSCDRPPRRAFQYTPANDLSSERAAESRGNESGTRPPAWPSSSPRWESAASERGRPEKRSGLVVGPLRLPRPPDGDEQPKLQRRVEDVSDGGPLRRVLLTRPNKRHVKTNATTKTLLRTVAASQTHVCKNNSVDWIRRRSFRHLSRKTSDAASCSFSGTPSERQQPPPARTTGVSASVRSKRWRSRRDAAA